MLGERIGWRRWAAVAVGFCGVLVMLRPTTGVFQILALVPLAAALVSSLRDIVGRRLTRTETSHSMMLVGNATLIGLSALTLAFGWLPVAWRDLALMAGAGCLIGVGQFLMIEAYRAAEAAVVAPLKYSGIVWAVLLGWLVWGHLPDAFVVAGSLIVVASGLFILHMETRRGRPG
jgi:drug/metabolite transporter (DMT)-like permease